MTENFDPPRKRLADLRVREVLTDEERAELARLEVLFREAPTNPGIRRLPSTNSLAVYREALEIALTRFEALNLDPEGLEAFHEAKELATVLDGWEDLTKLRMRGVAISEPDDADKQTVYRRVWRVRDRLEEAEKRMRDRLPEP